MIKLFESYSLKSDIEELSSAILDLSKEVFKDIKPKPFPVCAWISIPVCQFSLYYDSQTIFYCIMEISKEMDNEFARNQFNGQIPDEYYTQDITIKIIRQYPFNTKFIEPFFNYLRYIVLSVSEVTNKRISSTSFISSIKQENVKEIISKLNIEDYELWLEASKYNL